MDNRSCSDMELLSILVGAKTAQKILNDRFASLLVGHVNKRGVHPKLAAARELVMRALKEELRRGSVLENPSAAQDYLRLLFLGKEHEVFAVIFLDTRHRVIHVEELFRGTLDATMVYPREVVKQALALNAAAVILAHNHPSGVAEPSQADENLTMCMKEALALVEISVVDHLIIAGSTSMSLAERGLI